MRCDEILEREAIVVRPGDQVRVAAMKMREANIGFLPVCDRGGAVVGVLTDRDLTLRVLAEDRPGTTPVGDVMTAEDLVACRPDDEVSVAANLMREHQVGRVLVTGEDGRLWGVISLGEIAHFASDDEIGEAMRDVTDREVAVPPD